MPHNRVPGDILFVKPCPGTGEQARLKLRGPRRGGQARAKAQEPRSGTLDQRKRGQGQDN